MDLLHCWGAQAEVPRQWGCHAGWFLPMEEQNYLSQAYPLSKGCSACVTQKLLRSLSWGVGSVPSHGQDPRWTPGGWGQLPPSLALGMLGWQPGLLFLSIWVLGISNQMNFQPNEPNHIHIYRLLFCYRKATPPHVLQLLRCCQHHAAVAMVSPWSLHSSGFCQICLLGLKETFGLLIPKKNGKSIGRSPCWVWTTKLLKAHWRVQALSPKQQAHFFACSGICLQEWKEVSAAGQESVIHLTAPAEGECSPLFSELLPETIFVDIGLPSQGMKLLWNVYNDHLKPEKGMFLVMWKEPNTLEDKYSSFKN